MLYPLSALCNGLSEESIADKAKRYIEIVSETKEKERNRSVFIKVNYKKQADEVVRDHGSSAVFLV